MKYQCKVAKIESTNAMRAPAIRGGRAVLFEPRQIKAYKAALKAQFCDMLLPCKFSELEVVFKFCKRFTRRDLDNALKLFLDALCEYIGMDDAEVLSIVARKEPLAGEEEIIEFNLK